MSKTLVIMRHGKSTWDYLNISDMDRPLKESGISNTILIAKKIKDKNFIPDLIQSSPANRALHTALIVARELCYSVENIKINPGLYSEDEEQILDIVYKTPDNINNLFIFGHNPVFTDISNYFFKNKISNLPTSGCAIISFDSANWNKISPKNNSMELLFFPKSLNNE